MKDSNFLILGATVDELEDAVEAVEGYMNDQTGKNAIRYQVIGERAPLPWDTGYITDTALKSLQQRYIVVSA